MRLIMDGNTVIIRHERQRYTVIFNKITGAFVRYEDNGVGEPFWSEDGPELIDMSITNYCTKGCEFCYRQSNPKGEHMSLDEVQLVVEQAKDAGVLQIALGGGNPNQHPYFVDILKIIRSSGIVPTYTSNGIGLNDEILQATGENCGAMALSLYPPYDRYERLTNRIASYGIKLNLHVILKKDTIGQLIEWLDTPPSWFSNLNAIIVLNYKPINTSESLMVTNGHELKKFYDSVSACKTIKIGFDSCSVPGIVTWMNVNSALIEPCEAARFSVFISENLKMYPCSFMANTEKYGDLRKSSLIDVWQNDKVFVDYRAKMLNNSCLACPHQHLCYGGCSFICEINQCRFNAL